MTKTLYLTMIFITHLNLYVTVLNCRGWLIESIKTHGFFGTYVVDQTHGYYLGQNEGKSLRLAI